MKTTITSVDFSYIRSLVHVRSGLLLEDDREYLVESRLTPLLAPEGFPTVQRLVERLRSSPFGELHRKAIEAMTNNETLFFRDARAFALLKSTLLPQLLANRKPEQGLNIWCAACSSGQEPYSIAMAVRELPAAASRNVRIIGTDLSADVLARAAAGFYTQLEVNRGLPAYLLPKYFEQQRGGWALRRVIRDMVEFRQLNLIEPLPALPRLDLVLLRNVLIYFDQETKARVLKRVARLMAPDGYLLLGGAETTVTVDGAFETSSIGGAICFRLKTAAPRPTSDELFEGPTRGRPLQQGAARSGHGL